MKILLINNASLNADKFKEQNALLFESAKQLGIELEIKRNIDIKYYYDKLKLRGIDYTMYDNIPKELEGKKNVLHEKIIDDMKKYLENN